MNKKIIKLIKSVISDKWETMNVYYVSFCDDKYCITESKESHDFVISQMLKNGDIEFLYTGFDIDEVLKIISSLVEKYNIKHCN